MIIAIEGTDAAGKATQTKLLVERLVAQGVPTSTLSFPNYETETGQIIKRLLTDARRLVYGTHAGICPEVEALKLPGEQALVLQSLMAVNRYEQSEVLEEMTRVNDRALVLDRYMLSGIVYGGCDGLDPMWLRGIHSGLPEADLTLYLDISIEESFKRRPERRDAYEKNRELLERVRNAYLDNSVEVGERGSSVKRIDGMGTVEEVAERIWAEVVKLGLSVRTPVR